MDKACSQSVLLSLQITTILCTVAALGSMCYSYEGVGGERERESVCVCMHVCVCFPGNTKQLFRKSVPHDYDTESNFSSSPPYN